MNDFSLDYENAALREIAVHWRAYNSMLFGQSLKIPIFQLHKGESRLGYWSRHERIISISKDILMSQPWNKILAVLQHEMAHQFIDEVMQCPDSQPHGALFKSICKKFGIEQKDENELSNPNEKESFILEKIRKLLSLAQSDNVNESETAMKLANQLMLKWNVQHTDENETRNFKYLQLGTVGQVPLLKKMISQILSDFFFVETIWVGSYDVKKNKRGRVLEICGRAENLEIASYVYDYLNTIAQIQWNTYKKSHTGANKNNYQYGLMLGFLEKLLLQNNENKNEKALIWCGDPLLDEYFRKRHPRIKKMNSSSIQKHEESLRDGKKDGKKLVISKGIKKSSSKVKGLLPG